MKISIMKEAFQKHLQRKFSLRMHMFAILMATTLSGALFSKILLLIDVADFRIRYPLSVLFAYLVFFLCIKLWIFCISSSRTESSNAFDYFDLPIGRISGGRGNSSIHGGGGQFSGAGASTSFDGQDTAIAEGAVLTVADNTSVNSSSDGIDKATGGTTGSLGDNNIIVAAIVLIVLLAAILISAVYVVYSAPAILSEAAFQGVLVASLMKRTRTISDKAWVGSIFKATWKPFAVTLVVAISAGFVLHSYFPNAVKLADILWN